jgi:ABC-type glycerol-3-phosphate transport system permease component
MGFEWGPLMALTVVFALPVVVLFTFLQSRLVRGLGAGAGAVKF